MTDKITTITVRVGGDEAKRIADEVARTNGTAAGVVRKALDDFFRTVEQASLLTELRHALLTRLDAIEASLVREINSLVEDAASPGGQS